MTTQPRRFLPDTPLGVAAARELAPLPVVGMYIAACWEVRGRVREANGRSATIGAVPGKFPIVRT